MTRRSRLQGFKNRHRLSSLLDRFHLKDDNPLSRAEVAELADALDSGSSALRGVRVQIPPSAPIAYLPSKPSLAPFARTINHEKSGFEPRF